MRTMGTMGLFCAGATCNTAHSQTILTAKQMPGVGDTLVRERKERVGKACLIDR